MLRTTPVAQLLRGRLGRPAHLPVALPTLARAATTHAISNPTLANIEKRWEGMPPQEQAELWMALRDRMRDNWKELTLQEKKAGEWTCHNACQAAACAARYEVELLNPSRLRLRC